MTLFAAGCLEQNYPPTAIECPEIAGPGSEMERERIRTEWLCVKSDYYTDNKRKSTLVTRKYILPCGRESLDGLGSRRDSLPKILVRDVLHLT